jgi:hypothetical protein
MGQLCDLPDLLDEQAAARYLQCSRALLRKMRWRQTGPRWTKVGHLVRYPKLWLLEFLEANGRPALQARAGGDCKATLDRPNATNAAVRKSFAVRALPISLGEQAVGDGGDADESADA